MTNISRTIEVLPIEQLVPYARNSRTHSDEQVAQIAASIREFGFTNPVLIDKDGGIIAGHGRVMARASSASMACRASDWATSPKRRSAPTSSRTTSSR